MNKISVCIIMKNEASHIEKCLKSLNNLGFGDDGVNGEIVLVDTGSTDNSLDIASKYLKQIHHFDWVNDFAKAKNYCISLAQYRYVLIIDADEYLTHYDKESVEDFINQGLPVIGRIKRSNPVDADGIITIHNDVTERLFDKNSFHFEGCIHEQVVPISSIPFEYKEFDIHIDHDGYLLSKEELIEKANRNNELLFKSLEKDDKNSYIYFQIGQSYMMMRDTNEAAKWFEKGLALKLDFSLEYVSMMVCDYGNALITNEEYEKALLLTKYYDNLSTCPEYVFMIGNVYLNLGKVIEAYKEFMKCLLMKNERTTGTTSFFPLHNIGVINEMLGCPKDAITFYKKAADMGYSRSIQRLKELTQQ